MHVKKGLNKHIIFVNCLLLLVILTVISSIMVISGVSAYVPNENDVINISFAEGSYYTTSAATQAVTDGFFSGSDTASLKVNSSGCIILPDGKLSGVVINSGSYTQKDDETYIFNSTTGWSYSFTGWHIVGSPTKIPGKTVFQPGDVITPDVLELYVSGSDGNYSIAFEALWGKCYYGRNPYAQMVYSYTNRNGYTWSYPDAYASAAAAGISEADALSSALSKNTNDGLTPDTPKASIDSIFKAIRADTSIPKTADGDITDAYSLVVMLTGDLDYMKDASYDSTWFGYANDIFDFLDVNFCNFMKPYRDTKATDITGLSGYNSYFGGAGNPQVPYFAAVTFKSLGDEIFSLDWKPPGNTFTSYCSFRFDNVNVLRMHPGESGYTASTTRFQEHIGNEFILYSNARHSFEKYVEITARCNQSVPAGRKVHFDVVRPYKHEYCVVNGGGAVGGVHNFYSLGNVNEIDRRWCIGRNANVGTVYGGIQSTNINELVTINSDYDMYITGGYIGEFYGGSNNMYATTIGTRDIFVLGDKTEKAANNTQYYPTIGNFYGGGARARNFGDINVLMNQAKITYSVYGGGNTATATVYGDVTLNITGTDIGGSVYGGGKNGNTEKHEGTTYTYYKYHTLDEYGKPMQDVNGNYFAGYSSSSPVYDNAVLEYTFNLEGTDTLTDDPNTTGVETVNVPLAGYDRVKADILASSGNVDIDLQNSTVGGSVYGSGTGSTNAYSSSKMAYLFTWTPANWDAATGLSEGCYIKDGSNYIRLFDYTEYEVSGNYLYQKDAEGNRIGRMSKASCPDMSLYTDNGNGTCSKDGKTYNIYTLRSGTGTWDTTSINNWMSTAPNGYPINNNGEVLARVSKNFVKNSASTYLSYPEGEARTTLSIATVENVDMDIFSTTIADNVYGGGSIAKVINDTNVVVRGTSNIGGTVFGGGDGTTMPAKANIYFESAFVENTFNKLNWIILQFDNSGNCSKDPLFPAQTLNNSIQDAAPYYAQYTWSADASLLETGGFDHENKLVYSPNMNDFGTVGGDTHVTIENGTVKRVVGGGNKGNVEGDTNVIIENGTVGGGLDYQAVSGAGDQGDVFGNTNLHIEDGLFNGYVYGGAQLGKIKGNVNVTLDGGTYKDYFFAGSRAGDIGTEGDSSTGNITTVVNNGNFEPTNGSGVHFIGGNNAAGTIYGNVTSVLNNGSFMQTHGANNGDAQHSVDGAKGANILGDVVITLNGGEYKKAVYGGSNNKGTQKSCTINVNCEVGDRVYGGGWGAKHYGTATVNVNENAVIADNVYGGGNAADSHVETAIVNVNSGAKVKNDVYGGSNYGSTGTATVYLTGCKVDDYVYGGGYGGETTSATVNLNNGAVVGANVYGGGNAAASQVGTAIINANAGSTVTDTIYGGSDKGSTNSNTVNLTGCTVGNNVYGGGYEGRTETSATININEDAVVGSNVYGGGNKETSYVETATINANAGSKVDGSIYGGSDYGTTYVDTVNLDGCIVKNIVYGAGHGNTSNVETDATVNFTAGSTGHLFGGGNNGKVSGNTYVLITGSATFSETGDRVYGGGLGADATVVGTANLTVKDIDLSAKELTFYGGGSEATTGSTNVVIDNSKLKYTTTGSYFGCVYGGGRAANVVTNTNVTITNGSKISGTVYGGNNDSGTVGGNTRVNINGRITSRLYGGGRNAPVTGTANIYLMSKAVVDGDTYGGGKSATCGNTYINTVDGAVSGTWLYGGGESADVTDTALLDITGGEFNNRVFGGGSNGTVGTVIMNVSGGNFNSKSRGIHGAGANGASDVTELVQINVTGGNLRDITGGSLYGKVTGDIEININGGTFRTDSTAASSDSATAGSCVYGGCQSSGTVSGNVTININHSGGLDGVFGGGAGTKPVTTGDITVNVDCEGEEIPFVYGGGENATIKNAVVNIKNGIVPEVYGGGKEGPATGNTTVNISGDTVTNAYGGGNNGTVEKNTTVNVSGGTVTNAFGGGNGAAAIVSGDSFAAVSGGTVTNVYGGGNAAKVSGNSSTTVSNGTVTNTFGGGNGETATVSGNANLTFSGGTTEYAYGGGNKGTVEKDVNFTATGGTVTQCTYCGANQGDILGNIVANVSGGTFSTTPKSTANKDKLAFFGGSRAANIGTDGNDDTGHITLNVSGGNFSKNNIFGANNASGTVYGDVNLTISGGESIGQTHGASNGDARHTDGLGGYPGAVIKGDVTVNVNGGTYTSHVYGGCNNEGTVEGDIFINVNKTATNNIYGGGYGTNHKTVYINVADTGTVGWNIYGGGNAASSYMENVYIDIYGKVNNSVFGGGNKGNVGTVCINAHSGSVKNIIYGGGSTGDAETTEINLLGASVGGDVYGGGNEGDVVNVKINSVAGTVSGYLYGGGNNGNVDNTTININGGTFKKDINGGGKNGTARATEIFIYDKMTPFAGGFDPVTIDGNVYGGGEGANATVFESTEIEIDLGYSADVQETAFTTDSFDTQSGQSYTTVTNVTSNSRINGSVYGGGDRGMVGVGTIISGMNKANITTVGTTKVTVKDGFIAGSVFGGGRGKPGADENYNLYMGAVFGNTDVEIDGGYIGAAYSEGGIVGSVYGGGEQSRVYGIDGKAVANVKVDATAVSDSKIIISGSVFGGGDRGSDTALNASVPTVIGDVNVNIIGKEDGAPIYFLTGGVYGDGNLCLVSGKRTINITDFVTGADGILKTFYSIQRADVVNLNNAEIVLLGALDLVEEGDDTLYSINRVGQLYMNNGSTVKLDRIVKYLGGLESDVDTERPFLDLGNNGTNNYTSHGGDASKLNVLNSENSKEVEEYIRKDVTSVQNDEHNVLCVANGLYVDVMKEDGSYGPVTGLFTLQLLYAEPGVGGGFVYGDIETSTGDFICTTKMTGSTNSDVNVVDGITYMGIIDNVGKLAGTDEADPYDYYYWYINGGTVYTEIKVTGYLGTDVTEFSKTASLPSHTEQYRYVLEDVEGLDSLKNYLESGYQLVQTENVSGQQIALEFRIGGESVGFVEYSGEKWYIRTVGGKQLTGLDGVKEGDSGFNSGITENTLLTSALTEGNNTFEFVFHKSADITETVGDLGVNVIVKTFKKDSNSPPDNSPHMFNITSYANIKRIDPTQSIYYENIRSYIGLSSQIPIHITKESSFTTEIQTRYVPKTFADDADSEMSWIFTADKPLPAGTKLSFIDMSGSVPTYYYYICHTQTNSVNLLDFMQMGTEITIRNLDEASTPAFIAQYKAQKGEIATERLLFVVDFLQVSDWSWTDAKYSGNVTLAHKYDGNEIMDYTGSDGVLDAAYTVYQNEVGIEEAANGFTIAFEADSYPDKGTAILKTTITENDVAIDSRFYEGDFAVKLELVDAGTGDVLEMPQGITFTLDGNTYLVGADNRHAIVPISYFGSHEIEINNSITGIQSAIGGGTTVKFKATLYSAPEATYYNSIATGRESVDTYKIGSPVQHALKVKTKAKDQRTDVTNLILSANDALVFDLQTYQQNDSASVVNVEAYAKTDSGFTARTPLTKLFTDSSETLAPTETVTENSWTVGSAEAGIYRLVFTYAERTEYIYFIVE